MPLLGDDIEAKVGMVVYYLHFPDWSDCHRVAWAVVLATTRRYGAPMLELDDDLGPIRPASCFSTFGAAARYCKWMNTF